MTDKHAKLRLGLEIFGGVVAILGIIGFLIEYEHNQARDLSNEEHAGIYKSIDKESGARAASDKAFEERISKQEKAVETLTAIIEQQTRSISLLIGEVKIVLHRLNLGDGG
jgi:hypothetical protein